MTALGLLAAGAIPAHGDDPGKKVPAESPRASEEARKAVERGLAFLQSDAEKWRQERTCATCHHGTMTVWTLSEAKSQGYAVNAESLRDVTTWTKERLQNLDKPRDTRPGWNMVNTPGVYLALMALAVPTQTRFPPMTSSGSRGISCGTRSLMGPGLGRWHPPRTGRPRSSSRTRS
jgi:hypothetical protein